MKRTRLGRLSKSRKQNRMCVIYIKPRLPFVNVGGAFGVRLNSNRIYRAEIATNQPDYKKKGLVFVSVKQKLGSDDFLLGKDDYKIVKVKK